MIRQISTFLTGLLVKNNQADLDKLDWYVYGFELLLGRLLNYAILLLVGLVCGYPFLCVLYIGTVFFLRGFTGGYHSDSSAVCLLISVGLTFLVLMAVPHMPGAATAVLVVMLIPAGVCIFLFAPVNHPDLAMTEREIRNNRITSRLTFSAIAAVVLILYTSGLATMVVSTLSLSVITVATLVLLAKITKQEVRPHEAEEDVQHLEEPDAERDGDRIPENVGR